jgi:hypothetical protein
MTAHSSIVGGSTAKRVIACPGSVALCAKMPPQPPSPYAEEGTLLHSAIQMVVESGESSIDVGLEMGLTDSQIEKLRFCEETLDLIDPLFEVEWRPEQRVEFDGALQGVFGTVDMLGVFGETGYVLDWKFGDGVAVEAKENEQLLFYAAAARASGHLHGTSRLRMFIVQPPFVREWATDWARVDQFETDLLIAVKLSQSAEPPMALGSHCRWCAAKPICPMMTGAADRALRASLEGLDAAAIGEHLQQADLLEDWIKSVRDLGQQMLENTVAVPGWKLVQKQARRKWVDEARALEVLGEEFVERSLMTPAQVEKVLKKRKETLPDDLIVAVSSGVTLATEADPRPAVVQIGRQLTAALSKIV